MGICATIVGAFTVAVAGVLYFRHRLERGSPEILQRSQRLFVTLGFLLAPLTPVAILCALKLIINASHPETDPGYQKYLVILISGLAYVATLILAVPTYFVLRRFKLIRWWSCTLAGFLMGDVAVVTMSWYSLVQSSFADWLANVAGTLVWFGAIGAASGFLFWAIVRPRIGKSGS